MKPVHDNKRFTQLDALRGLAALTVVFFHYITRLRISEGAVSLGGALPEALMHLIKYTPLRVVWAGHEAVILFFVLSGFVMSLSFLSENKPSYYTYFIKRICRIYIPYAVILLCSVLMRELFYSGEIPGLSTAFNSGWKGGGAILPHLLLLGDFDTRIYNGSIWTLVHEMRISVIFPPLIGVYKNAGFGRTLLTAFFLSFAAYAMIQDRLLASSLVMTIHYTGLFLLGSILARYRHSLAAAMKRLPDAKLSVIALCGVLTYTFSAWGDAVLPEILHDWIAAGGAVLFILLLLSWDRAIRLLQGKALVLLGQISYSLYLWHIVILNALLHSLYGRLALPGIYALAFSVTVVLSWITHRYVELPAMRLGKILTGTNR